jgi:hypothetical protein
VEQVLVSDIMVEFLNFKVGNKQVREQIVASEAS